MHKTSLTMMGLLLLAGCGKPEFTCGESHAYNAAQRIIERHLKSPSTAKFPLSNASTVTISASGKCKYQIDSYVDSQNAFGATVRTPFSITVEGFPAKDEWLGSDLLM